jgi:hypothetical protein
MKRGYLVGTLVIAVCVITAVFSLRGAATANASFAAAQQGGACQVYGKLLRETIQLSKGMTHVRFVLEERETGRRMDFLYDNPSQPITPNFASATDIRAVGAFDPRSKTFAVSQIYTKCPSKYKSEGYKAER